LPCRSLSTTASATAGQALPYGRPEGGRKRPSRPVREGPDRPGLPVEESSQGIALGGDRIPISVVASFRSGRRGRGFWRAEDGVAKPLVASAERAVWRPDRGLPPDQNVAGSRERRHGQRGEGRREGRDAEQRLAGRGDGIGIGGLERAQGTRRRRRGRRGRPGRRGGQERSLDPRPFRRAGVAIERRVLALRRQRDRRQQRRDQPGEGSEATRHPWPRRRLAAVDATAHVLRIGRGQASTTRFLTVIGTFRAGWLARIGSIVTIFHTCFNIASIHERSGFRGPGRH
jgi:hypothetical protein